MTARNIPLFRPDLGEEAPGWKYFPVATGAYERIVCLPIHSQLSDADVDYVIESVKDVIARSTR